MQLSETLKLYPSKEQYRLITETMETYIKTVNSLVALAVSGTSIAKYTTADVDADLPSALLNQCIRDARSVVKKHYRNCHATILGNRRLAANSKTAHIRLKADRLPVLRRPCAYVNNQNFRIVEDRIVFPVMANGRSTRISVKTEMTDRQKALFDSAVFGTMRIVFKNSRLVAQIIYEAAEQPFPGEGNIMGVDLGIKCPAVCYVSNGKVKFLGNGRKNKYMRRHYAYLRKHLQKAKKVKTVIRINNKEQRIMRDIDHKVSHDIIEIAVRNHVKVIRLEQLQNIRSTARKSRKNNHSLHTWSFYRLAQFIEYKARLAGIKVEYVNPAYTSQYCPKCGAIHHAKDRNYACGCGYHVHRDLLGAINICCSTEAVGNRLPA